MRFNNLNPISIKDKFNPVKKNGSSALVSPGKYKVSMFLITNKVEKKLAGPVDFNIVPVNNKTIPNKNIKELVAFEEKVNELKRTINGTEKYLNNLIAKMEKIKQAIINTPSAENSLMEKSKNIEKELKEISLKFRRNNKFPSVEENPPSPVTLDERLQILQYTHNKSTAELTQKEKEAYNILITEFPPIRKKIKTIEKSKIEPLEIELEKLGAPWTPGRLPMLKVN